MEDPSAPRPRADAPQQRGLVASADDRRIRLGWKTTVAIVALSVAVAAGVVAQRDRLLRLVSAAPDAVAGLNGQLLDADISLAAARVDFVGGRWRDAVIAPGFLQGFVPRPLAQSQPLYGKLRPMPAPAWQPVVADARPAPARTLEPGPVILASLSFPPPHERQSPDFPLPAPESTEAAPADEPAAAVEEPAALESVAPGVPLPVDRPLLDIPLPMPRPAGLPARVVAPVTVPVPATASAPAPVVPDRPRMAGPQPRHRMRGAPPQPAQADTRTFFEKLVGAQPSSGQTVAYAPAKDAAVVRSGPSFGPFSFGSTRAAADGTAIYDISARTVILPSGERLEAHSGFGDKLDDPRQVTVKMRGATPPHVYQLSEREQLFHGVRALRLTPLGGSDAVHGRVGLLAHSYMLGPRGDSNGCVSFKDYNKFLQAYQRGEIKRLVVVANRT